MEVTNPLSQRPLTTHVATFAAIGTPSVTAKPTFRFRRGKLPVGSRPILAILEDEKVALKLPSVQRGEMKDSGYKGVPAGAIASGFFVAASSFLVLYFIAVIVIIAPEGRPDDVDRAGLEFDLCLVAAAMASLWLGWRTKRFFDRRAGRR